MSQKPKTERIRSVFCLNPHTIIRGTTDDMEQCSQNADLECLLLRNQLDWE